MYIQINICVRKSCNKITQIGGERLENRLKFLEELLHFHYFFLVILCLILHCGAVCSSSSKFKVLCFFVVVRYLCSRDESHVPWKRNIQGKYVNQDLRIENESQPLEIRHAEQIERKYGLIYSFLNWRYSETCECKTAFRKLLKSWWSGIWPVHALIRESINLKLKGKQKAFWYEDFTVT